MHMKGLIVCFTGFRERDYLVGDGINDFACSNFKTACERTGICNNVSGKSSNYFYWFELKPSCLWALTSTCHFSVTKPGMFTHAFCVSMPKDWIVPYFSLVSRIHTSKNKTISRWGGLIKLFVKCQSNAGNVCISKEFCITSLSRLILILSNVCNIRCCRNARKDIQAHMIHESLL